MRTATVEHRRAERLSSEPVGRPRYAQEAMLRALDVTVAALLLILLVPLLAVIAVAIKLDSSGPVLFRQRRLGRDQKPFTIDKFRTMHRHAAHDAHREFVLELIAGHHPESTPNGRSRGGPSAAGRSRGGPSAAGRAGVAGGAVYKMTDDERVTSVGSFLRRCSLDELPQLWNVLRGDMSLVGPRPPIPYEVEHYPAHWLARFAVKPGITGLWQVQGRSEVPLEEMVRMDIDYARRRSLALNLWLLLRTVPAVLSGRGAS